jgi:hypothetical protein
MRPPRRGLQQFHLLGHQKRAKLRGKPLDEILVRKHCVPVGAAVGVVLKLPQMDELIEAREAVEAGG